MDITSWIVWAIIFALILRIIVVPTIKGSLKESKERFDRD